VTDEPERIHHNHLSANENEVNKAADRKTNSLNSFTNLQFKHPNLLLNPADGLVTHKIITNSITLSGRRSDAFCELSVAELGEKRQHNPTICTRLNTIAAATESVKDISCLWNVEQRFRNVI
jgi:hypothetical protein